MNVSIAIATFNGEKFIRDQLDSIINQTLIPNEIVICDDSSSDDTFSIVKNYARNFKSIVCFKIFKNETNLGYTANFERAMSLCKGELILLCDQDDFWLPTKVETIVHLAKSHPEYYVFVNNAELTDHDLNPLNIFTIDQYRISNKSLETYKLGCCCSIRKDYLSKLFPFPKKIVGHEEWVVGIAEILKKKYIHHEVLQFYRRHDSNVSDTSISHKKKFNFSSLFIYQLKFYIDILINSRALNSDNGIFVYDSLYILLIKFSFIDRDLLFQYITKNKKRIEFQKLRKDIRPLPKWRKSILILILLIKGKYSYASGFKSAALDFIQNS
jgi:glycosyltransferase involved in cell wall biosynthesis